MPKAWSEREKELVKSTLLKEGRRLFEKYGLYKTTVDEIARAAKISKGAFYLFYRSKEELYFAIVEAAEKEFREKVFETIVNPGPDKIESFKAFLRRSVELMTSMPILGQFSSADYEYFVRKLPADTLKKHVAKDMEENAKYFKTWMEKGWMRKINIKSLQSILLILFYFVLHHEELGGMDFTASSELLFDMIATYLVSKKKAGG
jgi:AcrR family transcriptional regulator